MDEKSRNSLKLDIKGAGVLDNSELSKELYKPIPEENQSVDYSKGDKADFKMVQDEDKNDGADEKMLDTDDNLTLAIKKDEVKFISGDQQNGDAKIDIGVLDSKAFTGMTKDELMKYANDPFWVRLRWTCFVLFWAIWAAMLIGAILIIINAPKCAAPTPLVWYKQGPLAKYNSFEISANDLDNAKGIHAKGVIYELPAEDTYAVTEPHVEENIKTIIRHYKEHNINVILDITPNYVTQNSRLFKQALDDEAKRSAFIWIEKPEIPNNWLSTVNGSAWDEIKPKNYILSQFGDGKYDLHMSDPIVKTELIGTFEHLIKLGVKGFRLNNAKHFLLTKNLQDEVPSTDPKYIHTQYGFWTHSQTTFQDGLGDVLHEYTLAVKNASNNEAFLAVKDDTVRAEVFKTKYDDYGVDLLIYGPFAHSLGIRSYTAEKHLYNQLQSTFDVVGHSTWLQWNYDLDNMGPIHPSAYNMFLMMLPGVPVIPAGFNFLKNISGTTFNQLENHRHSPSFMHGNLKVYHSDEIVAYSRIKSGNPGFFVALNPTDTSLVGNFSSMGLPEKMTFDALSDNFNYTGVAVKSKITSDAIPLSPYSAAVLTYVPVKSN